MGRRLTILLLAGNTQRARAYAQQLATVDKECFEIEGLFLGLNKKTCKIPVLNEESRLFFISQKLFIPNLSESLPSTFIKNKWSYSEIDSIDINSKEVIRVIKNIKCDIVVFAGYGGQILNSEHFIYSKKYLHMHPGKLPLERGSTTIYYSILNGRPCTVTAFYMSEKIDLGCNLLCREYPIPNKGVDIDNWFDVIVRADCLKSALLAIWKNEIVMEEIECDNEEYYIIHPVLKHIALLSLK